MIELVLITLFFISGALIVYHHLGYPLLLNWLAKSKQVDAFKGPLRHYQSCRADRARASITIVIPAYNEQEWIADKIRNLACLDYPRDRYNVIIACDGCTDDTVSIAEDTIQEAICSETHFEIFNFTENRGKVAIINHLMPTISSDITALSDVSALISIDALLLADHHFHDARIGVLNSQYQLGNFSEANLAEEKYWRYQSMVQLGEAHLGANIGAHGAFYLFRTHLFQPLANNTINDDFILPMAIVRRGYKAIYEPNVMAIEQENSNSNQDYQRRIRISAGNMQQAIQLADLFLPRYRAVAFAFASGKGLRLLTPYLMIFCFISSAILANHVFFALALGLQLFIYGLAGLSMVFPRSLSNRYCRFLSYFVTGHIANFYGGLRYIAGIENGHWKKV
ncbi:glycosyltransferase family 2 protein [Vibrio renipiscarius]|uniref:Glycosyl transferase n=1 Tax=Vibrio renipiscarius TaxID=1461322 RepID=A0A0C2JMT7_9VIBR|nr:glycosyltransferase family 2 protein [Vibrio renipiscarius]KII79404.1 glycosyl transferase [Vibrio renipiscarius]KII80968.1 glycosyl transferase [Vibrio renipiscarius]